MILDAVWIVLAMGIGMLPNDSAPDVFHPDRMDRSLRLAERTPSGVPADIARNELRENEGLEWPAYSDPAKSDPVAQLVYGLASAPALIQNFEGIRANGAIPPDTNGEAGSNHYVQMVNREFAVFSKTGALIYGPASLNTLWAGFGGVCQTGNHIDPIVVYDQLAGRWLLSAIAYQDPSTFVECIALSTTDDPTGSYYRYSYSFPYFNDYPKFGVWPDGYYSTYILRDFDFSVVGTRICAFDRVSMLSGGSASVQCFAVNQFGLLPADLDGNSPPPAGSPHFSIGLKSGKLGLFKLQIDWNTPSASRLTGPRNIGIASYTQACGPSRVCIPQPGATQKLDAFSDRLMFRLAYRNMGTYDALVTNHSVDSGGGISGIRWYEIRNPGGTPSLYQQGTFAPDSTHRWLGSIGMDSGGNIALGYNVSSSSIHPGIRFTGRLAQDAKGKMTLGEGIITSGGGSQTGIHNWGDYSDMTVDPSDDCTFWYTSEYIPSTGSVNWRTRIAAFRLPSCGCADPSGLEKPMASDLEAGVDSGVLILWNPDPASWGDGGGGERSYEIQREKITIAVLPYGTGEYIDTTGINGQSYNYRIYYRNGCGEKARKKKAVAADQ